MTASHRAEVGRLELTVDKLAAQAAKISGQMDEGKLGGTGRKREHALTEEGLTDIDAVETTYKIFSSPHLDADGKTLTVHLGIGLNDVGPKPGSFLLIAVLSGGTIAYHTFEVAIDSELVLMSVHELAHGVADVDLTGKDDKTLQGTEPLRL